MKADFEKWLPVYSKDICYKNIHVVLSLFTYQIAFGMSIGVFDGLRLRVYFLCFKIALNIEL